MAEEKTGLALLREPFEAHQIGKLPKPTKAQTDAVKADFKKGIRCEVCGGWHHPKVIHLDYVGHAALTDRLLDCDPEWNWEPFSVDDRGQPCLLPDGSGMWLRLTVCGVTRPGLGDAGNKKGGDAIKEIIGDGLRNAAMRFGAALDLWHKGDLHIDDDGEAAMMRTKTKQAEKFATAEEYNALSNAMQDCTNQVAMDKWVADNLAKINKLSPTDKARLKASKESMIKVFTKEAEA